MADNTTPPLRSLRVRMAAAAREVGKPQYVLEKDYALSYLLAGIVAVPQLADSLVFKGGTCLRKAYFPGYRFSEDLDFTSRSPWRCEELLDALVQAADNMKKRLLTFGPFEVVVAEKRHREPHPHRCRQALQEGGPGNCGNLEDVDDRRTTLQAPQGA